MHCSRKVQESPDCSQCFDTQYDVNMASHRKGSPHGAGCSGHMAPVKKERRRRRHAQKDGKKHCKHKKKEPSCFAKCCEPVKQCLKKCMAKMPCRCFLGMEKDTGKERKRKCIQYPPNDSPGQFESYGRSSSVDTFSRSGTSCQKRPKRSQSACSESEQSDVTMTAEKDLYKKLMKECKKVHKEKMRQCQKSLKEDQQREQDNLKKDEQQRNDPCSEKKAPEPPVDFDSVIADDEEGRQLQKIKECKEQLKEMHKSSKASDKANKALFKDCKEMLKTRNKRDKENVKECRKMARDRHCKEKKHGRRCKCLDKQKEKIEKKWEKEIKKMEKRCECPEVTAQAKRCRDLEKAYVEMKAQQCWENLKKRREYGERKEKECWEKRDREWECRERRMKEMGCGGAKSSCQQPNENQCCAECTLEQETSGSFSEEESELSGCERSDRSVLGSSSRFLSSKLMSSIHRSMSALPSPCLPCSLTGEISGSRSETAVRSSKYDNSFREYRSG